MTAVSKFCGKCGHETERTNGGVCKPCQRAYNFAYSTANKDKLRAKQAAYRAANLEKIRAKDAAYCAANRERARARAAAWYAANPEKIAAYRAANRDKIRAANVAWNAANPLNRRINEQNRRARKRATGGKLSPGLAEKLFKLQRGKCACGCKQPLGTDYHLDHRMPLALGGEHADHNMQLLRATCNNQKYAKHPIDFMQQRGFLL